MYQTLSDYYRRRFGCKVYKLAIDGGFTCPNRDGTCGTEGCIYCSGEGSGEFTAAGLSIPAQFERQKQMLSGKWQLKKYVAYFQAFTKT